jgi:hypothetical protein
VTLEHAFRDEWGRVLATLIGFLGDFDLAEEAAQEAFAFLTRPTRRGGVSIEGLGIAVDNRRNVGPGTRIPALCPAIVVVIVAAFGDCTEPPCPSPPVCLIGLGGPDLEIAVGGLQNI